jgi:RNA polymerase sigma-70 factor (ECF subfamily)
MAAPRNETSLRSLCTLFGPGTAAGLTDGQLLEQFATRGGETSELAFTALVERHGPMVLRACRAVLRDEHDAQDAFQATFLILARHGGSLWVHGSVGPWLHRVACRAAARARRDAQRRRESERRAAQRLPRSAGQPPRDDLGGMLHEEVDRLPDRYRTPVVLCDLEGRTYDEAAQLLGCPVGTVKSRLARGRQRLRLRLARRGLAPGAVVVGAALGEATEAAVLSNGTIQAALRGVRFKGTATAAVPATVAALTEGVLRAMILSKLRIAVLFTLSVGLALGGLAAGTRLRAQQATQKNAAPPAARSTPSQDPAPRGEAQAAAYAWRRTDVYEAPDFNRFFPDDSDGGMKLDALWKSADKDEQLDTEILQTVRQGLRRTREHRTLILSWIGNRYVWGKSPQNPAAVEIMYHAADFRGPNADPYGTRHYAVYFGLSVVRPKTPAILRTLAELCVRVDDPNDLSRVAWGAEDQQAEILAYLKPFLASQDPATREKAAVVEKILRGDLKAFEWADEQARKRARAKYGDKLPEIKKTLMGGNSFDRRETFRLIARERLDLIMDDSFVAAFRECADDKNPKVRSDVAVWVGLRWIWYARTQNPDAVDLELRLSNDADREVRYQAVYNGLSTTRYKREEVVRRLLTIALTDREPNMYQRIAWGLQTDRDAAAKILDEFLRSPDPEQARAAREVYHDMTGRSPQGEPAPGAASTYAEALRDLHQHLGQVYPGFALKGIDWTRVGQELLPRARDAETDEQFGLLVEELVARLEDSHALVQPGTAKPPVPDLPRWDPGLACLIDDRGKPVVYVVERGSPAAQAGVRPGMTVVSIDGLAAADAMNEWMREQRRYAGYSSERALRYDAARGFVRRMSRGAPVSLALEDPQNKPLEVKLAADFGPRYLPRLPVPRQAIKDAVDVSWTRLEHELGYIYVRRIRAGLEAAIDRALNDFGDIKGLVIDVRGNSGGGFDAGTAFRNFDLSGDKAEGPERPRFKGPIALLIDERCTSAGEGWASWFVAKKRARVFGTTTEGSSSRNETYTVKGGLYKVVIPVKHYTGFLDRPIERRGLEPDVEVRCTAADLAQGRDTVVEAAIRWLSDAGRN